MELAKSTFWLEGPSFLKDVDISGPSAPSVREETKVEDVEKTVVQTYIVQARVNLGFDPNYFSTFRRSTICYKLQTPKGITKTGQNALFN